MVNNQNDEGNLKCIDHYYAIRDKVFIINKDVDSKARDMHIGPYSTSINGTISERGDIHY